MWPVGRGRGRGKNRLPTDGRHLGSFVVVGSRLQPTTGQGSNLVHQSSPRPGTLIYACQEQKKKAQGTQAHSRPNTRNDHSHNTTKKKQVLPLMFFFMTTNKKQQCYPGTQEVGVLRVLQWPLAVTASEKVSEQINNCFIFL